ncbi:cytochrome o ubiquinol oxidase subunit IV [Methylobrevis pamukkalensis]|uniref:Cytochrome bo(3) ubiquinol oxidase subunit 4 n=1 Tax=Methylobrevis pamukkalensis TaxID=1439726 RepID=A0A1E3H3X2_9HYPH|nr:cytochrome o ubiquinol oxidase subunit IV [Methylobrevis pamukkalensis]ODN71047.1 Cytochrome bo(3) ubiquinol oxidase subunit 4 [Methylobrevis pamukkalensis]
MTAKDHREDHPPDMDDAAPGEEAVNSREPAGGLRGYVIGFGLAILLTAASFAVVQTDLVYPPAVISALVVLAIGQMGVHLVFFLHLTTGPDNTNNAVALAFGVFVVVLVVLGSIWIMSHLNHNMMPMHQMSRAGG